jgi:hypothetical protein
MKNSMYPSHVSRAVVRSTAFLTILSAVVGAAFNSWILMIVLAVDFAIRGFLNPRWSLFSRISKLLIRTGISFSEKQIFFPPKQFAARIGLVFSASSALLFATGLTVPGIVVAGTLALFAAMECFLNICMGCILYNAVVAPLRKRRSFDVHT